ncbi:lysozyme [Croceicoccus sp. YJ47]|uniref:lysozyme n=1 Tax=Croceicoccus sp. YJ47 TaxID=2798724 RepID=UPI0019214297|nr:hypothetical protein [Croceicoccus sp. YJ47]QQN75048.1 hypothetical protein JD971_04950 [Croceicoccus sp. YJ47]
MSDIRDQIFGPVREHGRQGVFNEAGTIPALDNLLDSFGVPTARAGCTEITPRIAAELIGHEGIVLEAYKDSVGVWTWSVGLAETGGHDVQLYKDNPQTMAAALQAFVRELERTYLPPVLRAFAGKPLSEAQLGAALSFHYNTGAIERAEWVKRYMAGDVAGARAAIMNWVRTAVLT